MILRRKALPLESSYSALPTRNAPGTAHTHVLPESASILLDIVRFSAAIAVVVTHLCLPDFHTGFADHEDFGYIAVPVFFVLSGFVIRFVTRTRENHAKEYFIDRASRIYSVVLPALVLTLIITALCFAIDHDRFLRDWAALCTHPFSRLFLNLTFISQAWGHNTIPFLDIPFWSLGYECPYYVFYGLILFLRGWRRVLSCILLAALLGPQVLFLLPIWWLGCWTYDLYQRVRGTRMGSLIPILAAGGLVLSLLLFAAGKPQLLQLPVTCFNWFAALPNPLGLLGFPARRATMLAMAAGIYAAVLLLILLLAVDRISLSRSTSGAHLVRSVAEGTFAIYLMHFPLLVLAYFLGLLRYHRPVINVLIATGICILLILAAAPINSLKHLMRSQLHRWFHDFHKVQPAP